MESQSDLPVRYPHQGGSTYQLHSWWLAWQAYWSLWLGVWPQCCQRDQKQKWKKRGKRQRAVCRPGTLLWEDRSKKSKELISHSVPTVCMYHCAYIDTVTQNRAVERRASRCWCSTGNPLHCQGSPVSTGCWEVLGYWVCLSSDRSRQLQKQAIVIFACVLQDRVLKGSHFLFSCLHFFPLFLRLCTS